MSDIRNIIKNNYIIEDIKDNYLIISSISNPDVKEKLSYSVNGQWKIENIDILNVNDNINNLISVDNMVNLPEDVIREIALNFNILNINNMCNTNSEFNRIICNTQSFWKHKFYNDYKFIPNNVTDWKQLYTTYGIYQNGKPIDEWYKIKDLVPIDIDFEVDHLMMIDKNNNVWRKGVNEYYFLLLYKYKNIKAKKIYISRKFSLAIDMHDKIKFIDTRNGRFNNPVLFNISDNQINKLKDTIMDYKIKKISIKHIDRIAFVDIEDNLLLYKDGVLYNENIKVKDVVMEHSYIMIIDMYNNLYVRGNNNTGHLGLNDYNDRDTFTLVTNPIDDIPYKVSKIVSENGYTLFLDMDSKLYSFGNNRTGQLGLGDFIDRITPTLVTDVKIKNLFVGDYSSIITDMNDNTYFFGSNNSGITGISLYIGLINIPTLIPNIKAFKIYRSSEKIYTIGYK